MKRETEFADQAGEVHTPNVQHGDEGAVIVREQFVGDIRENCLSRRNEGHHGTKDMRLMASLPPVLIEHYCTVNQITFREFMHNPEHVKRMVNDPALSDFRIAPGRM